MLMRFLFEMWLTTLTNDTRTTNGLVSEQKWHKHLTLAAFLMSRYYSGVIIVLLLACNLFLLFSNPIIILSLK